MLFCSIVTFAGLCWIALPFERKPTFRGLGDPVWTLLCLFFEISFLGRVVSCFYRDFHDFHVILNAKCLSEWVTWGTFWIARGAMLGALGEFGHLGGPKAS